jgi:hypothetical protein
MYEADYPGIKDQRGRTENDPYVPIDLIKVASRLNCKSELLFGRLYYHLDQKYRYKKDSGDRVKAACYSLFIPCCDSCRARK